MRILERRGASTGSTIFWKAIANHRATLKRMWENVKQVMAPGALDPLTKELVLRRRIVGVFNASTSPPKE